MHPIDMPLATPPTHARGLRCGQEESSVALSPLDEDAESCVSDLWMHAGAAVPPPSSPPPPPAAAALLQDPPQRLMGSRERMPVRPTHAPASPFSPFPSPGGSPVAPALPADRRPMLADPQEDQLALSAVAGVPAEPASPAHTHDSALPQHALQPFSRSSIIYLDSAVTAAPARSSAYRHDPNHCSCWRFVTWSWNHCHSHLWLPLTNVPSWARRWRRGQQLVRDLSNHSGSGPPASAAHGCSRRCAGKASLMIRRHWILCSLLALMMLVLWMSVVSVMLFSHDGTMPGAGERDFISPLGRVSSRFLPPEHGDGEAAWLLDPSQLSSHRQWNLHNSDSSKLAPGVTSQTAVATGAGSVKAPLEHRHLHLHELSEKLQAQADSRGHRLPAAAAAAVPASPVAVPAAPIAAPSSGDLSDAMIAALQKSWEGLTPAMQAERKQRASKQSKQAKQAQKEAERIQGRIRTKLEHDKYVKPEPILPLVDRKMLAASSSGDDSSAWPECACLHRNLPKFALLQDKLLSPTLAADPQTLPLIDTLLDSMEACAPMEPECAARWNEEHHAAMDELLRGSSFDGVSPEQPQPLSDRTQPPPPHPPIAILLSPSHLGLTLSSNVAAPDDASLRLSPRWTELRLLLLRLWSMPGVDPSRIFLFMPRLTDGATSSVIDVPAWFRSDWRTLRSQSSGDLSADASVAGAAHARIVSAFLQLQIMDIEAASGVDGEAWARERAEWEFRRSKALAEFDRRAEDAAAAAADDSLPPPPLSSVAASVARVELEVAFSTELHRMRSNIDHWSLLTYLFDPEDLPDPMVVDLMQRRTKAGDQRQPLQSFDSLILLDPQSLPSLDLLRYFTRTNMLLVPPLTTTSTSRSTRTDHSIVLVSASNVAPNLDVASSSESQLQFASISDLGMHRSTGWSSPSIGSGGGAWMLARSLFESVRTCQTCWPSSDLSLGGGGGAHAKSTAPRSSKRTQRSNDRQMARNRLIRAAQEREGNLHAPESPVPVAPSPLAVRPSQALLSSSVAVFNEDSCRLRRWDEPFAKFVAQHNEAQRALEEATQGRGAKSSSSNKGPWRGVKSLESLQPLVSRVRRIDLRSAASPTADLQQRVQDRIQRANFLPNRWTSPPSDLSSLFSRSYQQQVYSRLYSVHEHDIIASTVDPGWSALSARFFSPEEIAAEDLRVRREARTRLQAVDEELLPCLLALWLSPAARGERDAIVLLDDISATADDGDPESNSHSLWHLIGEGLMGVDGSTPAVHQGLMTWIRPSSSGLQNTPSIFFLGTSSLYHTHYAIARSNGRRGINRATMLASLRALGSTAALADPAESLEAATSRPVEDGSRILMSALFSHAVTSPSPASESRVESSVLFPDIPPIDRTWHHDHNCLSLLRDLPEHAGSALTEHAELLVHPRLVYRPSLNSLSDASSDSKLHLRNRWNVRIPRLRHGRGCESGYNTTEEEADHGWVVQQTLEPAENDRADLGPEDDPAVAPKSPVLLRAAPPVSSSFSQPPPRQGPVSPAHFAPRVCMVVGHAGESCTEVCAGLVSAAPDTSAADGSDSPSPPAPSSDHTGLFRCAPAAFELLHTFPLVLSRYFRDFGFCSTHREVTMHARWDAGEAQEWHPSVSMPGPNNQHAHCDLLAPTLQRISTCEAKPAHAGSLVRRVCPCEVTPTQQSTNTKQP